MNEAHAQFETVGRTLRIGRIDPARKSAAKCGSSPWSASVRSVEHGTPSSARTTIRRVATLGLPGRSAPASAREKRLEPRGRHAQTSAAAPDPEVGLVLAVEIGAAGREEPGAVGERLPAPLVGFRPAAG